MTNLPPDERAFLATIARLGFCNPFLPERIELEKQALGDEYVTAGKVWSLQPDQELLGFYPNTNKILEHTARICATMRDAMASGEAKYTNADLRPYEEAVFFILYNRFQSEMFEYVTRAIERGEAKARVEFYPEFERAVAEYFGVDARINLPPEEVAHVFACFFQIRRAFHHLFGFIIGGSLPAARVRAAAWQSIFTHDMRRYRRSLYSRMGDMTTLITGASGTGKEVVARAIGVSRYIPFDPVTRTFGEDFLGSFIPINISALPSTLIESELFGHRRGAFTGALQSRVGWLELCPALGTVFLDEIGELDGTIQVKLLRVLQERTFSRIGETEPRRFEGKIIAATNRDLESEMREGGFREDFYYRLCSDIIETSTLRDQLADTPSELGKLVRFITRRIAGEEVADSISEEITAWIERELGVDYAWPGNVRELEQCVRNYIIRGSYTPRAQATPAVNGRDALTADFLAGSTTAEQLLVRYCTIVYAQTGNYQETARRLELDHRTVKRKIDHELLDAIKMGGQNG